MKYKYGGRHNYGDVQYACNLCNIILNFKTYVLLLPRPCDYYIDRIRMCNTCAQFLVDEVRTRQLIEIYNDTFSDTIEIVEYLKLALGRVH